MDAAQGRINAALGEFAFMDEGGGSVRAGGDEHGISHAAGRRCRRLPIDDGKM